jgi:DNA repair protein RecO (recombination protein O)
LPEQNITGIVLRCYDLGEKDKILVLLTEEGNKLRVVAKGAKRPGGRFAPAAAPLMELSASIHFGRNLHTLRQVEIIASHRPLREQLDLLAYALFMVELVDLSTVEAGAESEFYQHLGRALRQLESTTRPQRVMLFFEVLLLELAGLAPAWQYCASCQSADRPLVALSATAGGLVCEHCAAVPGSVQLPAQSVTLLRYLAESSWEDYAQIADWSSGWTLSKAIEQFLFYQLEAKPKSYQFLNSMRAMQS